MKKKKKKIFFSSLCIDSLQNSLMYVATSCIGPHGYARVLAHGTKLLKWKLRRFYYFYLYFGKLQLGRDPFKHLNAMCQCACCNIFIPVFFFISRSSNRQLRNCLDIVMSPIHLNPLCQINLGNTRLMKWKHVSDFLPPVPSVNELCKLNLPRALCQRCIFFFFTDWLLSHLIMRFVACIESGSGR